MTVGLIGRKSGMTRVFTEDGASVPVTVIEAEPNRVTRVKEPGADGYRAVQVTAGACRADRLSRAEAGHFSGAGVAAGRGLWELRLGAEADAPEVGAELTVAGFAPGQKVNVAGRSKGKGFQGVVKRWNFSTQDASHGNSLSHRAPGSLGQCQTPGRVFKGKKMAGRMGGARVTALGLEVVLVDSERNMLLVKGAVPGAPGGDVIVSPAPRAKAKHPIQMATAAGQADAAEKSAQPKPRAKTKAKTKAKAKTAAKAQSKAQSKTKAKKA